METVAARTNVSTKKPKIKLDFKDSKYATGRRKKSIAKIIQINSLPIIHVIIV